jgi:hypothetical protein
LVILGEDLEGVTGYDDQFERMLPTGGQKVAEQPLDIRAPLRYVQHRRGGLETD